MSRRQARGITAAAQLCWIPLANFTATTIYWGKRLTFAGPASANVQPI
jgi:hypothetical protein